MTRAIIAKSFFIALGIILVVLCIIGGSLLWIHHTYRRVNGYKLRRVNNSCIEITWKTPSRLLITPKMTLEEYHGTCFKQLTNDEVFPPLAPYDDVWMYAIDSERIRGATPAIFVNPRLDKALDMMEQVLKLTREGNTNKEVVTRLASQSYIYVGWIIMNEEDIAVLLDVLADRSKVTFDADLITPHRILYRIRKGVEKHFVIDQSDDAALQKIRQKIPVMFENLNAKAGHPCDEMHVLYLDGHIECIPFGKKFPAVQAFVDAFCGSCGGQEKYGKS